ncbi:MAG: hypothetical protein Q9220_006877 [cf. Caloplaca sp. 1 TL-2023]
MFLLIGSNAMQLLALKNEFNAFTRRADAKISLLKDVIERVQRGEGVDVKGLLGTGNPEKEREWEQVIKELEEEDRLWQAKARRRQNKESSIRSEDQGKKPSSPPSLPIEEVAKDRPTSDMDTAPPSERNPRHFPTQNPTAFHHAGCPISRNASENASSLVSSLLKSPRLVLFCGRWLETGEDYSQAQKVTSLAKVELALKDIVLFGEKWCVPHQMEFKFCGQSNIDFICSGFHGYGHVNNVQYVRYAESARIIWAQNYARYHDPLRRRDWEELWTPRGNGLILRSITTEFKFPMTFPDRISVYHKLRSQPTESTDSFILDVLVLSERHQRAAARCVEDIVVYDYRHSHKTSLKPFMFDQFSDTWKAQEEAKVRNGEEVQGLLERVRRLEKDSRDREGAVEDMGFVT